VRILLEINTVGGNALKIAARAIEMNQWNSIEDRILEEL